MDTESGKTVGDKEGEGSVASRDTERIAASYRERRLEQAAIRHRWAMPREKFQALCEEQARIAMGGTVAITREYDADGKVIKTEKRRANAKERTGAFKALVAADALNMEQEKRDLQIPDFHEHNHSGQVEQVVEIVRVADWFGRSPNAPTDAEVAAAQVDLSAAGNAASSIDPGGAAPL